MAQNLKESKPSTADDAATSLPKHGEQSSESTQKPQFTILRPNASSISSTPTEASAGNESSENAESQDQITGLSNTFDELQMEDDVNDSGEAVLDEFIINALKSRQDRIFLLKLDRDFCNFLNSSQESLELTSLNSYHRMVVHRVANYFKITRVVDTQQKKIVLFKTEQSAIPALRFLDLVEEEEEQPVRQMKLLKRNPNRSTPDPATGDGSSEPDRKMKTIKDREEEYARARARIFNDEAPAKPKSEGPELDPQSIPTSVLALNAAELARQDEESTKPKNRRQVSGKKTGPARSPDQPSDGDGRQNNQSLPNSRNVSRSASPTPSATSTGSETHKSNKGLVPKTKLSKPDLAAECADTWRRKSNPSNAPANVRTTIGLARTISSSSSQDGFQSPGLGATLTESPTVNSPSNSISKTHDYFGQNPAPSSGSVSPLSSGSSRGSYSYPQPNAPKPHRPHSGTNSGSNHILNNNNFSHMSPNTGFGKGMNQHNNFSQKKPYPKHSNSFNGVSGVNNFNSNPVAPFPSGPNAHGPPFNTNGNGNNYTHPQHISPPAWQDRGPMTGHDQSFFNSSQDPSAFPYSNQPSQFSQPVPNMHPQFNNHHNLTHNHPNNNNSHQNQFHPASNRGRRNPTIKPNIGHQPHYQHPHHARTHPQIHSNQFHHNNFNASQNRDDFGYSQGPQSQRYNRQFEGNPNQVTSQFNNDMYQTHGMSGEAQNISNAHPGFGQLMNAHGENSVNGPRYPHNQKGSFDQNWNQGQNPDMDSPGIHFNMMSQPPGKKPYNNYQGNTSMNHHMMGAHPQGNMVGQPPSMMGGPGIIGGGNSGYNMYDIERRPPKSAELFDPNGPSLGASNNSGQGDFSRHSGLNDTNSQDNYQPGGERSYQGSNVHQPTSQHGAQFSSTNYQQHNHPTNHQHQFQNQSNQNQHQPPQQHSHQQQTFPSYTSVLMNRSYSSSSSTGHGGSNSGAGSNMPIKKNSLLYDHTAQAVSSPDATIKSSSLDSEAATNVCHILEIYGFDPEDDIIKDMAVPAAPKIVPMKSCILAVFKNASLASEALAAFQSGKDTWLATDAKTHSESFGSSGDQKEVEGEEKRPHKRFNVRVWTPTVTNSTVPTAICANSTKAQEMTLSNSESNTTSEGGSDSLAEQVGEIEPPKETEDQ